MIGCNWTRYVNTNERDTPMYRIARMLSVLVGIVALVAASIMFVASASSGDDPPSDDPAPPCPSGFYHEGGPGTWTPCIPHEPTPTEPTPTEPTPTEPTPTEPTPTEPTPTEPTSPPPTTTPPPSPPPTNPPPSAPPVRVLRECVGDALVITEQELHNGVWQDTAHSTINGAAECAPSPGAPPIQEEGF